MDMNRKGDGVSVGGYLVPHKAPFHLKILHAHKDLDDGKRCCPWFDWLTMRAKPLKTRDLILSLSKDGAKISCFFSRLPVKPAVTWDLSAISEEAGPGYRSACRERQ
jgi:hypothetical protein